MSTKGRKIHRGLLLEAAVKNSSINITQMVKRMGIARTTYYNHITEPDLPLELMARYGKVIKHDFSDDLPQIKDIIVEEPEAPYKTPETLEEAIEQRDFWRERYYKLMEKYHSIIEKREA